MAVTTNYSWPLPEGTDDPAVPADMQALGAAIDTTVKSIDNRLTTAEAHNHSGVYSLTSHDHSGVYSPTSHNHAGVYQPLVTISTSDPSGGVDGDVWFKY